MATGILTADEKLLRLGYARDTRLLIINGDDLGSSHAANTATFAALEQGLMTSASLMAPCPWAYAACRYYAEQPDLDVGVHLTLTSEWAAYRWGPVLGLARCPSLVDDAGFFPHRDSTVYDRALVEEATAEAEEQVRRLMQWGLDATNIDGHMGVFYSHPRFLAIYIDLARRYDLPLRLPPRSLYVERGGAELYGALSLDGLWTVDHLRFIALQHPERLEAQLRETLARLEPGITELVLHAAAPTEESQAIQPDWQARAEAYRLVSAESPIRSELERRGIVLIGWRRLRDAQRAR